MHSCSSLPLLVPLSVGSSAQVESEDNPDKTRTWKKKKFWAVPVPVNRSTLFKHRLNKHGQWYGRFLSTYPICKTLCLLTLEPVTGHLIHWRVHYVENLFSSITLNTYWATFPLKISTNDEIFVVHSDVYFTLSQMFPQEMFGNIRWCVRKWGIRRRTRLNVTWGRLPNL